MIAENILADVLANALQDRIHPTSGRLLARAALSVRAVRIGPPIDPPRVTDEHEHEHEHESK